jgi:hypothetical protein
VKKVGPEQTVPEGFVQHSPFYYLARQMEVTSAKKRRIIYNHWARVFGLTIVKLKQELQNAK